jgi:thiamine biosynthesis lipoprotein
VTLAACGCPDAVWDDAWRLLRDADGVFNRFAPDSEISRLAGLPDADGARLSPLLAIGVRAALRALHLSRGAADASVRPLVALWRTAVAAQEWPDAAAIAHARGECRLVDAEVDAQDRLRVDGPAWIADLDLGGVVKGVLVDLVAQRFAAAGVGDVLVQIGGETTVRGHGPAGGRWRIGVQHPLIQDAVWGVLVAPAAGLSCSTSADYRRGWTIAGVPVSHLIDPRSGMPARADLLTAHVAMAGWGRCGDAEALTKALALLSRDEADDAVRAAGGEWLHVAIDDDALVETRSYGFAAFTDASSAAVSPAGPAAAASA